MKHSKDIFKNRSGSVDDVYGVQFEYKDLYSRLIKIQESRSHKKTQSFDLNKKKITKPKIKISSRNQSAKPSIPKKKNTRNRSYSKKKQNSSINDNKSIIFKTFGSELLAKEPVVELTQKNLMKSSKVKKRN